MALQDADIVLYTSANMPDDDSSPYGGDIEDTIRATLSQLASNAALEALSDDNDDTMNLTVEGRKPDGQYVTETKALTGTTLISLSTLGTIKRVIGAVLATVAEGAVTLRVASAGATVAVIPAGEIGFRQNFYNVSSDPDSGRTWYEKNFVKNNSATNAALNAKVQLLSDPSSNLQIDLEDAQNDTESPADRLTAPSGRVGTWVGTGVDINVPGTDIAPASYIGVWLKLALDTAEAAYAGAFSLQVTCDTTE